MLSHNYMVIAYNIKISIVWSYKVIYNLGDNSVRSGYLLFSNVDDFLNKCRYLIGNRSVDPFTQNLKTKRTLNLLGYSVRGMLNEIHDLTNSDLHGGPYPDRESKYGGRVWIFKKIIEGYSIYIKLKIRVDNSNEELFVMAFHIDD